MEEILTVNGAGDFSAVIALSEYTGQKVLISTDEGKRAYTGVLEFVALEDTSTNFSNESTLLLYFRGLDKPVMVTFPVDEETRTVLNVKAL